MSARTRGTSGQRFLERRLSVARSRGSRSAWEPDFCGVTFPSLWPVKGEGGRFPGRGTLELHRKKKLSARGGIFSDGGVGESGASMPQKTSFEVLPARTSPSSMGIFLNGKPNAGRA